MTIYAFLCIYLSQKKQTALIEKLINDLLELRHNERELVEVTFVMYDMISIDYDVGYQIFGSPLRFFKKTKKKKWESAFV